MPEELLPIYQIQDFREPFGRKPDFYFNTFEGHLKEHAFIQKPHKHDFYILILVTKGSGTHTIDFQQYPVAPGTVFFLSPGQVHAWELAPETSGFVLFFNPEFYLLSHSQKDLSGFPFFNSVLNKPFLQLPEGEEKQVIVILKQIEKEFFEAFWKKEEMIRDLLDILLITLTRNYHLQFATQTTSIANSTTLRQFENLIDEHFREHVAVSFYAGKLHLTLKQLNDLCKKNGRENAFRTDARPAITGS